MASKESQPKKSFDKDEGFVGVVKNKKIKRRELGSLLSHLFLFTACAESSGRFSNLPRVMAGVESSLSKYRNRLISLRDEERVIAVPYVATGRKVEADIGGLSGEEDLPEFLRGSLNDRLSVVTPESELPIRNLAKDADEKLGTDGEEYLQLNSWVDDFNWDSRVDLLPMLTKPQDMMVTYWTGGEINLSVPDDFWEGCVDAFEETGVNPYLLVALAHSETASFDPHIVNEFGMEGVYQFYPNTWERYSQGEGSPFDPVFSSVVAGRMLQAIGLHDKFYQALVAWRNGDSEMLQDCRMAFIRNFTGEDGSQCWNRDWIHAEYVFDTAIRLIEDRN
jgi:hypothetical protein